MRTVSRVVRGEQGVRAATARTVLAVAKDLGYVPDSAARALRTGRGNEVLALIDEPDELHLGKIVGMEEPLRAAGFTLSVRLWRRGVTVFDAVTRRRSAGVVLLGRTALVPPADVACIRVDVPNSEAGVHIDRHNGIATAMAALRDAGRQRIGYLGGPDDHSRLAGMQSALDNDWQLVAINGCGTPAEWQAGAEAAEDVLAAGLDAVQTHSDVVAMGLLAGLHQRGVTIPDDVAVVGFDDRRAAAHAWPPLSTVAQPSLEIGRSAADLLLATIAGASPSSRSIATHYIPRATT